MTHSLTEINSLTEDEFVLLFGSIYEKTPSIAQQTWISCPFKSLTDLHEHMVDVVNHLSNDDKLKLIRSHPDLGSRMKMSSESVNEQSSLGLDRLTPDEYKQFQQINDEYKQKFGIPFICAVKHHKTREAILRAYEERLKHDTIDKEIEQALIEINQIAKFRLMDLVQE
ncbi:unnamed protein product [Didymodactylos carnosus]|uniref:2-oxo-4-hydroxy-4-carboxy-5-ureidoimidazoline decarboxylase n=2 Tax=Didymodactylos carnosus TaxID=1234261 RepID=A0A8S2EVL8_9BILA|nr:unnamed protein product [Didymodactylos carnosus]CAF4059111.1 unnamed protein product [Didymodactylos carnosus]